MWFDLRPEEEPSRLRNAPGSWKSAQGVTLGCSYTSERGVMDSNSVSIILGWRLLAKPAKLFLVPVETWRLQSCRSPYSKGEGKLSTPPLFQRRDLWEE